MKAIDTRPSVGTAVSFVWDKTKLNGTVSSHEQCADNHVEVTVTKARKKADQDVYVLPVNILVIKA